MKYLTLQDVVDINERLLGSFRVRDLGLVEAAVLRPQTTVGGADAWPDLDSKAAALFHGIATFHGFLDGNKRTAVVAMVTFYTINGSRVEADQGQMYDLAMETAEGRVEADALAGRLKEWSRPIWTDDDSVEVVIVEEEGEVKDGE